LECGLLIGDGPFRQISVAEAEAYDGPGFLWLHLHGRDEEDAACLKRQAHIPDVAAAALFATETRPRCDQIDHGAIVNLRGPGELDPDDSDKLVSIRLWVTGNRVTSVSRRRMTATAEVMRKMRAGLITDAGDVVAAYAKAISLELDPQVAGLGDTLDEIESDLEDVKSLYRHRRSIMRIRGEAIGFRRFVAPNRDALITLSGLDFEWLGEDDRLHIREAADKFARMTEELESVRERSALLHEQITDLRSEQLDRRGLEISVVAFIFLPLTFITGLLGMNVEGIPYAQEPWAFWAVVLFCLAIAAAVAGYFIWRHKVHERE
jgi:zinc transporter